MKRIIALSALFIGITFSSAVMANNGGDKDKRKVVNNEVVAAKNVTPRQITKTPKKTVIRKNVTKVDVTKREYTPAK